MSELSIQQHVKTWNLVPAGFDALGVVFRSDIMAAGDVNAWLWLFDLSDEELFAVKEVRRYIWTAALNQVYVFFVVFKSGKVRAYCETDYTNYYDF